MMEIFTEYGFMISFLMLAAGASSALVLGSLKADKEAWQTAHFFAILAGFAALFYSLTALFSGATAMEFSAPVGMAGDILAFRIDGLAAFFIFAIAIVTIAASVFGLTGYREYLFQYRLGGFGFFYSAFLASMMLVVSANNAFLFLLAWEVMAISSYFLVVFERKHDQNIRAGTLYLLLSQLSAAFLFATFLVLYRFTGSWDFDAIRAVAGMIPFHVQNIILGLALVGAASKAGVIPLHIWLPEAHPAAPSHVSALMSGVMIKVAVFVLIRFFVDFFPAPHVSWGLIILAFGALSSLLGILYALSERDLKRLLAFSSVENIGIIFLGVGASVAFFSHGIPSLGVAALVAALYHAINHALFKSLLFLSAGSVAHAMHTRNMEAYGGLIRTMPWTAVLFLVGAVAISGLPPFNGFVSEWFTFQTLFAGIVTLPVYAKIVFIIGASALAFTGGLAAACFVKAFGATFLARPRSEAVLHTREADAWMLTGMGILAALTLAFGVAAASILPVLRTVAASLLGLTVTPVVASPTEVISFGTFSALAMVPIGFALLGGILAAYIGTSLFSGRRSVRIRRTWDCGADLTPRMEITATGFSRSVMMVFKGLLRPTTQTDIEYHDASTRFTRSKSVHVSLPNLYHTYLYLPVVALIERSAREAKKVQTGNLNSYLLYIFITLMALLYWALK